MKGMKRSLALVLALALVWALYACQPEKKEEQTTVTKQSSVSGSAKEPSWVTRGAGAFKDETGLAFYGVGVVQGIQNRGLEMQTADSRARADLARALDTYVANFMKDFMSSAVASDMKSSDEQQFVSSITKSITETTLVGSQIVNHYRGPDGTLYALGRLSFDDVGKGMKDQVKKRSAELKLTADQAVKELDEQLDKRKASIPSSM
jgi:hypothetical protein